MKKWTFFVLVFVPLFLSAQIKWLTDYHEAFKQAKEKNKYVLLVFSGSDWCVPCIKLEREIWQSEYFQVHAPEHFILLRADFPRKRRNQLPAQQREMNNFLAEKYNPNGIFPLVLVLDADGNILNRMGYEHISAQEYIQKLLSFR